MRDDVDKYVTADGEGAEGEEEMRTSTAVAAAVAARGAPHRDRRSQTAALPRLFDGLDSKKEDSKMSVAAPEQNPLAFQTLR